VADWASTRPLASPAVTAKYGPFVFTVIAVSNPARPVIARPRRS
jgi:hypothetical protein